MKKLLIIIVGILVAVAMAVALVAAAVWFLIPQIFFESTEGLDQARAVHQQILERFDNEFCQVEKRDLELIKAQVHQGSFQSIIVNLHIRSGRRTQAWRRPLRTWVKHIAKCELRKGWWVWVKIHEPPSPAPSTAPVTSPGG